GDDRARHAEFALGPLEDGGVALQIALAVFQPVIIDHARRKFVEGLAEDALRAVALEHALVDIGSPQRRKAALANACALRLLHDLRLPRAEIATALLGQRRRSGKEDGDA